MLNSKLIMRAILLQLLLFPFMLFIACDRKSFEMPAPNIIVILADDMGYGDLDCYGNNAFDTPHLDKMARTGLLFTDFHSNGPVCSPTRAALLSGQYQQRVGIEGVVQANKFRHTGMNRNTYTIAHYLKALNYHTAIIGKWHLGYDTAYSPLNFGFDFFKGYVSGNVDYHSHIDGEGIYDWWEQKETIVESGYTTDLITGNAVDFIAKYGEDPFFLYVAHEAPHFPFQGRGDPPDRTIGGSFPMHGSTADVEATYREMIQALDDGVGEIFNTLEEFGLLENTIVFFLSDNGAMKKVGSNAPFSGFKSGLREGGHRVPAMVYWKKRITPGISDETLMTMDIFPTLVSLTDGDLPKGIQLDGVDFSQILFDGKKLDERNLFWRFKGDRAVRRGPWKLLVKEDSTYLFNLEEDPFEQSNLIGQSVMADSLIQLLNNWENEMDEHALNTY
jgi:arylsulfatase A-like enzyme